MGVLLVFANEASNDNHTLIKNMFLRLNHLLKSKRDIYMDMTPVIIPIQGAPRVLSASVFRLGFCAPPSPIFGPSVSTPGSSGGRAAGTPIANPFSEFFKVA
jgi:hypothetical protein